MNKLDTSNNGGMPLELDDFRHYLEGIEEALKGVGSTVGGLTEADGYILSGMVVTDNGSTLDVSSGYCFFSGEVFYYPGESGLARVSGANKYIIELDTSYLAAGNEQFLDGNTYDTYEQRRAKTTYVASSTSGKFDFITDTGASPSRAAEDFKQKIVTEVETSSTVISNATTVTDDINSAWTSITMSSGVSGNVRVSDTEVGGGLINVNSTINSQRFRYKTYGKTAHIEMDLDITMPTTGWGIASIRFAPGEFSSTLLPKADNVYAVGIANSVGNTAAGMLRARVSKTDPGGTYTLRLTLGEVNGKFCHFGTSYTGWSNIQPTGDTIDQTHRWYLRFTMTYELN